MCGLAGIVGPYADQEHGREAIVRMGEALLHRGPDDAGRIELPGFAAAHRRLSILDLSPGGRQPMRRGAHVLLFNGEIYNYIEIRTQLEGQGVSFESSCDSEVLLEAYRHWGEECLDRLLGMFAFVIWNAETRSLFLARDRFGVKPLVICQQGESLYFASEIAALHAAGVGTSPSPTQWARFLCDGAAERGTETFWQDVHRIDAGECATFSDGVLRRRRWYDLSTIVALGFDPRPEAEVQQQLRSLLEESIRLRFRSDVPVGVCVSGGLDSSLLLALVARTQGADAEAVHAFTFHCGDERYDELPWVRAMLSVLPHRLPHHEVLVEAHAVPALAEDVARHQLEPAGGLATIAYARLFERARELGIKVLLDGQGVDEAWAGYDYYQEPNAVAATSSAALQGSRTAPTRTEALIPELRPNADQRDATPRAPSGSAVQRLQLRDLTQTKLPRALRYNDRVSMRSSVELREPFLDHRLVELGLRQADDRKILDRDNNRVGKRMPRELAEEWLPAAVRLAPKRPLQTPQREWLRGPLADWALAQVDRALKTGWLDRSVVEREWGAFQRGEGDNSFFIWQWIDLGLLVRDP